MKEKKIHGTLAPCKEGNTAQNILEFQIWSEIQAVTVPSTVYSLARKSAWPLGKTDGLVCYTYVTTTWAELDLPEAEEQRRLWEKINCALFKTHWNHSSCQPRVQQGASESSNTQATSCLALAKRQVPTARQLCVINSSLQTPRMASGSPGLFTGVAGADFWKFREEAIPVPWRGEC